jgi:Domain of unknown function (DUF4203)
MISLPLVILGLCLLIFGGRFPTTALFMMTIILVGTILMFAIYSFLPPYTPHWSVFLVMFFAYGNGAALGIGATMSPRIGVTVCGAAFGYFFGLIIDFVLIQRFAVANYATYLTIFGFTIFFALLSIPLYEYAVILSSSFIGSFMFWRVS